MRPREPFAGASSDAAAERARLVREATAARERLHALFMQAPAAIAIVEGEEHVFAFANAMYEELVGVRVDDMIGRPAAEVLPTLVEHGFIALLDRVRATGEPFHAQGVPYQPDPARPPVYHNFVYQPIRGGDGAVESILGMAVDVTKQVEAQNEAKGLAAALEARVAERTRELTTANAELRRANDTLESFAYVISHDLKEPVRAIDFHLGAIAEDPEAASEHLARAREANARQRALIQGLLEYSRASFAAVEVGAVDLDALAREGCRGYYEEVARERGAEVRIEALPHVLGHELLLTQLLGNLILNAIRHHPPGPARVHVHAAPKGEGLVDILVDDDGAGFPEDVKRRARDLAEGRPATLKGGFGLAIAHRAAARLGTTLRLEGSPEGGARAAFSLPLGRGGPASP